MANNKYELRSNDAQEIMRKSPRTLIARGNIIILSTLLVGFYFINKVPIYKKEALKCEIVSMNEVKPNPDSVMLSLSYKGGFPENVKPDQNARLFIKKLSSDKVDILLSGKIDSIRVVTKEATILFFKCTGQDLIAQVGRVANIEIITKKESLFSLLLGRFRFD